MKEVKKYSRRYGCGTLSISFETRMGLDVFWTKQNGNYLIPNWMELIGVAAVTVVEYWYLPQELCLQSKQSQTRDRDHKCSVCVAFSL